MNLFFLVVSWASSQANVASQIWKKKSFCEAIFKSLDQKLLGDTQVEILVIRVNNSKIFLPYQFNFDNNIITLDRFVLACDYNRIRKKFDMASLPEGETYVPSFNIGCDDSAYVLKSEHTFTLGTPNVAPSMRNFHEDKVSIKVIRSFGGGKTNNYFIRT